MRWLLSACVAAATAFAGYLYFTLRLAGDSSAGSAFRAAYASDILVAAFTLAAALGAVVAMIHARGQLRLVVLVPCLILIGLSVLSLRELQYAWSTGEVRDAWFLLPPGPAATIGTTEKACFDLGAMEVSIVNPETGQRAKVLRGFGPWSYGEGELKLLMPPC